MKRSDPLLRGVSATPSHLDRSLVKTRAVQRKGGTNPRKNNNESISKVEQAAESVELVALALAAGGYAFAAADRQRSAQSTESSSQGYRAEPTTTPAPPQNSSLDPFWLGGPLLLAVAARSIAGRVAK